MCLRNGYSREWFRKRFYRNTVFQVVEKGSDGHTRTTVRRLHSLTNRSCAASWHQCELALANKERCPHPKRRTQRSIG